jgi:tRNA A-37 threonylcarbamoyl transferase component Bud32
MEPAGDDPRVGQVLAGRWRLGERIARGGMGAIYDAVHVVTGKRVAVKTLLPGLARVAEIKRRFEREAHAASKLAHPNIVSVIDFGDLDDGAFFLVMELVNGRSLSEALEAEEMPPGRAFGIVRQVLEALAHAHAQGVIHRDLKPDNIMLVDAGDSDEERDIVKLLDFGIAKLIGEARAGGREDTLTQAGVAFGTPDYMAPEQALGEEVDGRADLYAAGVILFELLTGAPPFDSPDKMAVLRMHVAVSPPPLARGFGPELEAAVARALAKRREQRFPDAAAMLAALDAAVAAEDAREPRADVATPPTLEAPPPEERRPIELSRRSPGRRLPHMRLLPVLGGLGVVFVLLVLAIFAGGRGRPTRAVDPARAAAAWGAGWRAAGEAFAAGGRDLEAVDAHARAAAAEPASRDFLVEQAGRGKSREARARARAAAEAAGLADRVDLVASFSLDLADGKSCRERREAVPRLRALRDKRAIPALRRARVRSGGFLGLSNVNACLDRDAAEAIEFLQALP